MITLFALSLTLAGGGPEPGPATTIGTRTVRAPIELWMSGDRRFREGERARVQVETEVDGFLFVLHSDTEGRVSVLFPLDPADDAFVRAGRRYEVRATETSRDAFVAGYAGTGLVWAAVSADPWQFEKLIAEGRWDYGRFDIDRDADPEGELTRLAQDLSGSRGFDYDVVAYRVYDSRPYAGYYPARTVYAYDDYLFCDHWSWRYSGCNRWPWDGGFHIGLGFGGFYDPWYYYPYSPYRYRYGYYGGYPYRPYYPYYPFYPYRPYSWSGTRNVIVGRPRGYSVERRTFGGTTTTLAGVGRNGGESVPINWRAREGGRSRGSPSARGVPSNDFGPRGTARPARPAGDGNDQPRARPARARGGDDRGGGTPSAQPQGGGDRGAPRPNVERSRGRSRGEIRFSDAGGDAPRPEAPRVESERGEPRGFAEGRARRARAPESSGRDDQQVRRGPSGDRREVPRAIFEPRGNRGDAPSARFEPRAERRGPPAARPEPRSERREPPVARSEPRERREPPAGRYESRGDRRGPAARSEPRREAPAPRVESRGRGDGGGGGGGGGSVPSRSRGRGGRGN